MPANDIPGPRGAKAPLSAGTGNPLAAAKRWIRWLAATGLALGLLSVGGFIGVADAQTCAVDSSNGRATVALASGSCTIAPSTTLTASFDGSPGVHATNSAQIATSNVTIAPFDGGTTGALADNAGVITFNPGSTITGNYTVAASAQSGGHIMFQNGTTILPADGGGGQDLIANGPGSMISADGLTVEVNSAGGNVAAAATNGGVITLGMGNGTTVMYAGGGGNTALLASGAGSQIMTNGATVNMENEGGGDFGALAAAGAGISLTNNTFVSIMGVGGGDTGVSATGAGSTLTADSTLTVDVTGAGGDAGASATAGGVVTLGGGNVTVDGSVNGVEEGGGNSGLLATGQNSVVNATGVVVNVDGVGSNAGVNASSGGALTTTGGSVTVNNGVGGLLSNGGNVTMTGTNVTATGDGGVGFLVNDGGSNTLTYNGGTIAASDASFAVQGATATINLTNAVATTNNGNLLETNSSGTSTLNAQGSTLQGVITTEEGSTSTVDLAQSTWTMTGNSNTTNLTNDNSTINFTPPAAGADVTNLASYKTLTTNTFTANGGEINMNTFLGDDSSPSDRIIVTGSTMVLTPTSLFINNTGGPGAPTTGNGILVVQADEVGGTTEPGTFVLDNPELRPGASTYVLVRGGLDGSDPNDWFLRNTFLEVPPTEPATPPGTPTPPPEVLVPGPVFPVRPPPPPGTFPPNPVFPTPEDPHPPTPPVLLPIIGPSLATYGVVQPTAREMGVMALGTLQQRTGDTTPPEVCPPAPVPLYTKAPAADQSAPANSNPALFTKAPPACQAATGPAVWGRFFGQLVNNEYQAYADPRATGWMGGFEGGVDLFRGSLWWPGTEVAGVYFAYGTSDINVSGLVTNPQITAYILAHTGKVGLEAYSAGGYWTHYDPAGWYLDAELQGTFYTGGASTQTSSLPTHGTGLITSLEGGYPLPLPALGPGFVLEPQAQILWQQVTFDDENDGLGAVGLGTTAGFSGRLGARGQWNIVDDYGEVWQPYVGTNVWRDWGAQAVTHFGFDQVPLNEQATRLEFIGGLTTRINDRLSVNGEAGYQLAVSQTNDGVRRNAVQLDLGAHYRW